MEPWGRIWAYCGHGRKLRDRCITTKTRAGSRVESGSEAYEGGSCQHPPIPEASRVALGSRLNPSPKTPWARPEPQTAAGAASLLWRPISLERLAWVPGLLASQTSGGAGEAPMWS